jgi:hypothetical protein
MPTARGSSGSGTPAPSGSSGQQGGTGKSLDMIIPQSLRARHWAGFTRTMQTEMKAHHLRLRFQHQRDELGADVTHFARRFGHGARPGERVKC